MSYGVRVHHLVDGIRHAVRQANWYAALDLALAMPGICAGVETPPPPGVPGNGKARYVRWFTENVTSLHARRASVAGVERLALTGDDCYALRCAHVGDLDLDIAEPATGGVRARFRFVVRTGQRSRDDDRRATRPGYAVDLSELLIDDALLHLVPREFCELHQLIPVRIDDRTLTVAMVDPANLYAIDLLETLAQQPVEPVVTSAAGLEAALQRGYDKAPAASAVALVDVSELCAHMSAAVEAWLAKVADPLMRERTAGLRSIAFI